MDGMTAATLTLLRLAHSEFLSEVESNEHFEIEICDHSSTSMLS